MSAVPDDLMATPCAERRIRIEAGNDAARTLAFRRSLRASRARRAVAAIRRRRILRGRGSALVAAAGMLVVSGGAFAQQQMGPATATINSDTIAAAQRALGVRADGVAGPQTRRATRSFQRGHGLTVDGIIGPQTLKALGVDTTTAAAGAAGAVLQRIAQCESGASPTAVSADGRYRGKYQFSDETWRRVGGSGNPAAAPEAEQDKRAAMLMEQVGAGAWPVCGHQA